MNGVRLWLAHSDFLTVPLAIVLAGAHVAVSASSLILIAVGFLTWTLAEYWLHRALHSRLWPAMRALHVKHHQHPHEATGGTQYSTALIVALVAVAMVSTVAAALVIGLLAGYLAFIVLHHALHADRLGWMVPRRLAEAHDVHHHSGPRSMFGVTTTLWDRAFRTASGLVDNRPKQPGLKIEPICQPN